MSYVLVTCRLTMYPRALIGRGSTVFGPLMIMYALRPATVYPGGTVNVGVGNFTSLPEHELRRHRGARPSWRPRAEEAERILAEQTQRLELVRGCGGGRGIALDLTNEDACAPVGLNQKARVKYVCDLLRYDEPGVH